MPRVPLNLFIPEAFDECLSYEEQILFIWNYIQTGTVSPEVTITPVQGVGTKVTITDKNHPEGQDFIVKDGVSPKVILEEITNGTRVTIKDAQYPEGQTFDVMNGESGPAGQSGEDGYSPAVTISSVTGGHQVKITDKTHPTGQTFNVMDGVDGESGATGASGQDGFSPVITVEDITDGHRITITDASGTTTVDVMNGETGPAASYPNIDASASVDGNVGTPSVTVTRTGDTGDWNYDFAFKNLKGVAGNTGASGSDGFSPTLQVADITGGHRITITDVGGTTSVDVMDGVDGQSGASGQDGYSPAVTISSVTGGHRVKITDKTHPSGQTFDVMDGQSGATGASGSDGYSPAVTISSVTGGHQVKITDKTHPTGQTFNVMDGVDGQSGSTGPMGSVQWTSTSAPTSPNYTFAISSLVGPDGATLRVGDTVRYNYYIYTISSIASTTVLAGNRQSIRGAGGATGASGSDGFSPTVVPSTITGGHRLTITDVGGTTTVDVMDGVKGDTGSSGITPTISATASVDANIGTPTVTVTKSGTTASPSFAFAFKNLKGVTGATGSTGVTPTISATASVDANIGTPSVTVTKSGTTASPSFAFAFKNLKGASGSTGATGPARRGFMCSCATGASTSAKVVTVDAGQDTFVLEKGVIINVKFSNSNTATNVTLNVAGTGAKSIYYSTAGYTGSSTTVCGYKNTYFQYMYDGTYWVWIGHGSDSNTTYSKMTTAEIEAGTGTTGRIIAPVDLKHAVETWAPSGGGGSIFELGPVIASASEVLYNPDNDPVYSNPLGSNVSVPAELIQWGTSMGVRFKPDYYGCSASSAGLYHTYSYFFSGLTESALATYAPSAMQALYDVMERHYEYNDIRLYLYARPLVKDVGQWLICPYAKLMARWAKEDFEFNFKGVSQEIIFRFRQWDSGRPDMTDTEILALFDSFYIVGFE